MILHIDMDAFFASIEQAINPRLKGKPLIVGSRGNKMHTVVCAASYEAKAYGIDSGMSSQEAFQLCPNLAFVSAEQGKYIWTSEQILELLESYAFQTAYVSIDEFQIDAPNNLDHKALAQDIQNRIQQDFDISASIGVAKNCLLAKLASKINKPKGIAIFTDANLRDDLTQIPVEKLCGVGQKTAIILQAQGIKTCLDLYQKSPDFLEQILGKYGLNLYVSLHATDRFDQEDSREQAKSIGHSYTLPRVAQNPQFIQAWIRLLSDMVAQRLRHNNLVAHTVHLWLNGPEIANFGGQKASQQPTNDGYEICQRSLKIMARLGLAQPKIRAIGVTCSKLSAVNYPLLFNEEKRRAALLKAVDQINARHGDNAIYPAIIRLTQKIQ